MLSISASNGGGFVPVEEVAEALGMFQLQMTDFIVKNPNSAGKIQQIEEDRVWEFTYKDRVWRAQLVSGHIPHSCVPVAIRLHFDYLKQENGKVDVETIAPPGHDLCTVISRNCRGTPIVIGYVRQGVSTTYVGLSTRTHRSEVMPMFIDAGNDIVTIVAGIHQEYATYGRDK